MRQPVIKEKGQKDQHAGPSAVAICEERRLLNGILYCTVFSIQLIRPPEGEVGGSIF